MPFPPNSYARAKKERVPNAWLSGFLTWITAKWRGWFTIAFQPYTWQSTRDFRQPRRGSLSLKNIGNPFSSTFLTYTSHFLGGGTIREENVARCTFTECLANSIHTPGSWWRSTTPCVCALTWVAHSKPRVHEGLSPLVQLCYSYLWRLLDLAMVHSCPDFNLIFILVQNWFNRLNHPWMGERQYIFFFFKKTNSWIHQVTFLCSPLYKYKLRTQQKSMKLRDQICLLTWV